jgi:hypothetical protein
MQNPNDTDHQHPRAAFWLRAMELRKHELTREYRESLRDKAREGISEEDLRITDETLEKMAKNLGWDESQSGQFPGRGFGPGRGFKRGFRHHGMMHGFGHQPHPHPEDHTPGAPQA